jgi:hypothetical protein
MARIEFDLSRHPLIVFTVPEVLSPEDVDAHFERLRNEVFPLGRYASVMDASRTDPLDFGAHMRQHTATRYQEHLETFRRCLVSEAYVLESSFQRGVLTAIRWLAPAPWLTRNFGDPKDAVTWSLENLRREAETQPRAEVFSRGP